MDSPETAKTLISDAWALCAKGNIRLHKFASNSKVALSGLPKSERIKDMDLFKDNILVTCLYSRAVHIEVLMELSTDVFINALRCFMALRGPVRTIYSDQGTKFIGARNEFNHLIDSTTDSKLREHLLEHQIEFKTNSPHASHQGGVWERLIRSTRAVLTGMTVKFKGRLTTEALRTALCEAA